MPPPASVRATAHPTSPLTNTPLTWRPFPASSRDPPPPPPVSHQLSWNYRTGVTAAIAAQQGAAGQGCPWETRGARSFLGTLPRPQPQSASPRRGPGMSDGGRQEGGRRVCGRPACARTELMPGSPISRHADGENVGKSVSPQGHTERPCPSKTQAWARLAPSKMDGRGHRCASPSSQLRARGRTRAGPGEPGSPLRAGGSGSPCVRPSYRW